MAKTSLSGVGAILKTLYPKGQLPEEINDNYKFHKALAKKDDFVGENAKVGIKTANSQGVGGSITDAQAADNDPAYSRFLLTRNKFFGVARIDGEAAEAAVTTEGALVDLVDDKVSGAAQTMAHDLAVYEYGNGTATLGKLAASGTVTGTTVPLETNQNMNWLEIGMTVVLLDGTNGASIGGTPPTVRNSTYKVITGIDRKNKTFTVGSGWAAAANGDYVARAGAGSSPSPMYQTVASTNNMFYGLKSYVEGGASPGALYSLTRTSDPAKLAGQTQDYTGQPMEDAVIDAHSQCTLLGCGSPDTLVANPVRISAMKRSLGGKVVYPKGDAKKAEVGFSGLVFETEEGTIDIISDPFAPLDTAYLLRKKDWTLWSLGKAPHMEGWDDLKFLRQTDDDSFECRWKFYGAMKLTNPACQFRLQGFGL